MAQVQRLVGRLRILHCSAIAMVRRTIRLKGMTANRLRMDALDVAVRRRMAESGVDNYAIVDGQLRIGSRRYALAGCACGAAECDGLRLRPVQQIGRASDMPFSSAFRSEPIHPGA